MDINQEYDLAGRVIGLAMKVYNSLGSGFLEKVYHNSLIIELKENGIEHESEQPLKVYYNGAVVGDYIADLLIEGDLIIEIKSVKNLVSAHEVQLVNYLNAANLDNGLLLNFGGTSLEYKRKFKKALSKV